MSLDDCLNVYFENDERYADLLNGSIFKGKQVIKAEDLQKPDTKMPKKDAKTRQRDNLRRVAFGTNFAIIPLENQNKVDYQMPLRCMDHAVREYERQARDIARYIRKTGETKGLNGAEYLSGFRKADKLHPCASLVLFFGDEWDGSMSLHEMMDFTDIPEEIRNMVQDHGINLIQIKKEEKPDRYRTDLRQIFAIHQCAKDKKKMKELIETDKAYENMDEDAAALVSELVHLPEETFKRQEKSEGGKVNMCQALQEMMDDAREEGMEKGRAEGIEKGIEEGWKRGRKAMTTAIENVMKHLNKTAEDAMELMGIPEEERALYLEKL